MSAEWKPGDRALCIHDFVPDGEPYFTPHGMPVKGTIYLVDATRPSDPRMQCPMVGLVFKSPRIFVQRYFFSYEGAWGSQAFRKIVPACDRVEADRSNHQAQ